MFDLLNRWFYTLSGARSCSERVPMQTGDNVCVRIGDSLTFTASDYENLDVYVLGGEPIREPVAKYGPFVMNNSVSTTLKRPSKTFKLVGLELFQQMVCGLFEGGASVIRAQRPVG